MACRALNGEHMPIQAFQEAQNGFFFTEDNKDVCYIAPYMIATDGNDILAWQREEDSLLEIGWRFFIEKESSWWPWTKQPDFDTLVEEGVKNAFFNIWKDIKSYKKIPTEIQYNKDGIVRVGAEYTSLSEDILHVHSTNRGTYDVTRKFFFPIYFVVLPNHMPVSLVPIGEDKPCIPIEFRWLAANTDNIPMSFEAKKIMDMIKAGDIILPVINQKEPNG